MCPVSRFAVHPKAWTLDHTTADGEWRAWSSTNVRLHAIIGRLPLSPGIRSSGSSRPRVATLPPFGVGQAIKQTLV